jgi:hypothetical protein
MPSQLRIVGNRERLGGFDSARFLCVELNERASGRLTDRHISDGPDSPSG